MPAKKKTENEVAEKKELVIEEPAKAEVKESAEKEPAAKKPAAKKPAAKKPAAKKTAKKAAEPVAEEPKAEAVPVQEPEAPALPEPRRSVAFIGSECYPFVKTGGLGDVMRISWRRSYM